MTVSYSSAYRYNSYQILFIPGLFIHPLYFLDHEKFPLYLVNHVRYGQFQYLNQWLGKKLSSFLQENFAKKKLVQGVPYPFEKIWLVWEKWIVGCQKVCQQL